MENIIERGNLIMSMYGDSEYNMDKEDIYYRMKEFLESHPLHELLEVLADAVKIVEDK